MKEKGDSSVVEKVSRQVSEQITKMKEEKAIKEQEREREKAIKEQEKAIKKEQKEQEMEKEKEAGEIEFRFRKTSEEFKKYFHIFLVIACSMLFFILLYRFSDVAKVFSAIFSAAAPILTGVAIAYILNPVVNRLEEGIRKLRSKKDRDPVKNKKFCRGIAILVSIILTILMIAALFAIVIPEVTISLSRLFDTLPDRLKEVEKWWETFPERYPNLYSNKLIAPYVKMAVDYVTEGINGGVISTIVDWISYVLGGLMGAVNVLYNVVIGMIIAVYVLLSKEQFMANGKRIVLACMSQRRSENFFKIVRTTHKIFGGAITGKILDSLLVGMITYIALTIFAVPYASLVAVIVGVTNVIPFLGPFIGAIPSAILIFIVDPSKGLLFIVIIIVIQQIDCNLLDPFIVGKSIGLSPFWEISACLIGGGLFGLWGLLLGVPVFALCYSLIGQLLNAKLQDRELPVESDLYYRECTYEELKEEAVKERERDREKEQNRRI